MVHRKRPCHVIHTATSRENRLGDLLAVRRIQLCHYPDHLGTVPGNHEHDLGRIRRHLLHSFAAHTQSRKGAQDQGHRPQAPS